jgi:two-component system, LytTR family, sensor kinase
MIVEDPARSREMITELSDFLRYSLDSSGTGSTIGDEMQAVRSYLAIQRIRFDEQLDATIEAEDSTLPIAVPCFLIHPLVENAVKYGMMTSAMPLRVRVEVRRQGDDVRIGVANTGNMVAPGGGAGREQGLESTGIGLRNITERLKLVFPGRHTFQISESGGWVCAEIGLQLAAPGLAK